MRIFKLDGLRGLFSIAVVLYHYPIDYLPFEIGNNFMVKNSKLFVDFFFVLSGFVISLCYCNKIDSLTQFSSFMKKRLIRLFPLLFFTVTVYLIFKIFLNIYKPEYLQSIDSLGHLLYLYLDTILFLNSTPLLGPDARINGPSWSVSAEMISYIVFGLVVLFSNNKNRNRIFLVILGLSLCFSIYKGEYFSVGNFGFVRGVICFITGYFVWFFSKNNFKVSDFWEVIFVPMLVLIFYIFDYIPKDTIKQFFGMSIVPLFFGISILFFLKTNGYLSVFLRTKPMKFLGDISFSIYLNHMIFVLVVPKMILKIFKLPTNNLTLSFTCVVTLTLIILFSYFTYTFIEIKTGNKLKGFFLKKNN